MKKALSPDLTGLQTLFHPSWIVRAASLQGLPDNFAGLVGVCEEAVVIVSCFENRARLLMLSLYEVL